MDPPNFRCLANAEKLHASRAKFCDWRDAILDDAKLLSAQQKRVLTAHLSGQYKNTLRLFQEFVEPNASIVASQRTVYAWVKEFEDAWASKITVGLRIRGDRAAEVREACNSANLQNCSDPRLAMPHAEGDPGSLRQQINEAFREMGHDEWPERGPR